MATDPRPIDEVIGDPAKRDRWADEHDAYDREQNYLRGNTRRRRKPKPRPPGTKRDPGHKAASE